MDLEVNPLLNVKKIIENKCLLRTVFNNNSYIIVQGFQWKLITEGLPPPVGPLTAVGMDFINDNKNFPVLKENSTTLLKMLFCRNCLKLIGIYWKVN